MSIRRSDSSASSPTKRHTHNRTEFLEAFSENGTEDPGSPVPIVDDPKLEDLRRNVDTILAILLHPQRDADLERNLDNDTLASRTDHVTTRDLPRPNTRTPPEPVSRNNIPFPPMGPPPAFPGPPQPYWDNATSGDRVAGLVGGFGLNAIVSSLLAIIAGGVLALGRQMAFPGTVRRFNFFDRDITDNLYLALRVLASVSFVCSLSVVLISSASLTSDMPKLLMAQNSQHRMPAVRSRIRIIVCSFLQLVAFFLLAMSIICLFGLILGNPLGVLMIIPLLVAFLYDILIRIGIL